MVLGGIWYFTFNGKSLGRFRIWWHPSLVASMISILRMGIQYLIEWHFLVPIEVYA